MGSVGYSPMLTFDSGVHQKFRHLDKREPNSVANQKPTD